MNATKRVPKLALPFSGHFPVTFGFGEKPDDPAIIERYKNWGLVGHNGVDFGLPEGTSVLACAGGRVSFAGEKEDFGNLVILGHAWGESWYAHLSKIVVEIGETVKKKQAIGLSGQTGFVSGPHLHFAITLNNADVQNGYLGFVDPMQFLAKH